MYSIYTLSPMCKVFNSARGLNESVKYRPKVLRRVGGRVAFEERGIYGELTCEDT